MIGFLAPVMMSIGAVCSRQALARVYRAESLPLSFRISRVG